MNANIAPDLILHNGRITTLDPKYPEAKNVAIKDGRIVAVDEAEEYQSGPNTKVIDPKGRRVIPGLNDSHLHVIRGGLNYNMELKVVHATEEFASHAPPPLPVLPEWSPAKVFGGS